MRTIIEDNKEWIDDTWSKIDHKLSKTAIKSRNKLPYTGKGSSVKLHLKNIYM